MSQPRAAAGQRPRRILSPEDDPWLFTAEELENSPSRYAGIPKDFENECYLRASIYIRECAGVMTLPALTIAVAGTFMRRFYMLESVTAHNMAHVSSACLFLACKVSETHKRLRDFIRDTVSVRVAGSADAGRAAAVVEGTEEYDDEKAAMLKMEAEVLKILNFDLTVDQPFSYLVPFKMQYIKGLPDPLASEKEREDQIGHAMQNSFNFLVESIGMYVHIQFDAREIATAAVYLGVRLAKLPIQSSEPGSPNYLDIFGCDVEHIEEIANALMNATDAKAKFA
jgi:Cyclin, N-terminal domain